MTKKKDESVGYKRPPRAHQWKRGQSGNPRGRKRDENVGLAEVINDVFGTELLHSSGSGTKTKTVLETAIRRSVQLALSGNARHLRWMIRLMVEHYQRYQRHRHPPFAHEEAVEEILRRVANLRRASENR